MRATVLLILLQLTTADADADREHLCRAALESCDTDFVGCAVCAAALAPCAGADAVSLCRERAAVLAAPDPQDPPFDRSRVLFSGSFSDNMVLQRQPRQAAVYGTAKPG